MSNGDMGARRLLGMTAKVLGILAAIVALLSAIIFLFRRKNPHIREM